MILASLLSRMAPIARDDYAETFEVFWPVREWRSNDKHRGRFRRAAIRITVRTKPAGEAYPPGQIILLVVGGASTEFGESGWDQSAGIFQAAGPRGEPGHCLELKRIDSLR